MYFNKSTETLGDVPKFYINDILELNELIQTTADSRAVLGRNNLIHSYTKMTSQLQQSVSQLSNYVQCQQFPMLKNLVIHESMLITIPSASDIIMPTRYLCRVGELIIVPLQGACQQLSLEFPDEPGVITTGNVYRINNRINSRFIATPDFICAAFNFLDFDLRRHLMPHDLISPFVRRKDEYPDPESAPANAEVPRDAY